MQEAVTDPSRCPAGPPCPLYMDPSLPTSIPQGEPTCPQGHLHNFLFPTMHQATFPKAHHYQSMSPQTKEAEDETVSPHVKAHSPKPLIQGKS